MSPQDTRLEPYWALAEELDVPVSIHMGPGPPGAAYEGGLSPVTFPAFTMALGDPLLLEDVLLRHKRLRLNVAHAGWPRLESMQALLYAHPNVYVDVGALTAEFMVPRAAYYLYCVHSSKQVSRSASCSVQTFRRRSFQASRQSWPRRFSPTSRRRTFSARTQRGSFVCRLPRARAILDSARA